jgi:hypothetical protein
VVDTDDNSTWTRVEVLIGLVGEVPVVTLGLVEDEMAPDSVRGAWLTGRRPSA